MTYTRLVHAVYSRLPKGGELPAGEWERRHRAMRQLLWATAVAVVEAFCIVMADELAAATRRPVAAAVRG